VKLPNHSIVVSSRNHLIRLDKFLQKEFPQYTRSFLQRLINERSISVNGEFVKAGQKLKLGDRIIITIPDPQPSSIIAEKMDLDIIYEDTHILVINKPAGLIVHPGAGNYTGTLVNGLLAHCNDLSGINGILRPGIVHRLDKNTSGLLVVAKDNQSHLRLAAQFETREISRLYIALVWGTFKEKNGQIETLIDRSNRDRKKMAVSSVKGKQAITEYKIVEEYNYFSLVQLALKTGRTHQIRVHLQHIHHPVFGDAEYGGRQKQLNRLPDNLRARGIALLKHIQRQALHAHALSFIHPVEERNVSFEVDLPPDFKVLMKKLSMTFGEID
jgi:23S rRNA pseudouridine1911/1915/1917 synthase